MSNNTVVSPAFGEEVGSVRVYTAEEARAAFVSARAAQAAWEHVPHPTKKRIFLDFHDLVLSEKTALLDTICAESGKARKDAFEEVLDVALTARHYAYRAGALLRPRRARAGIPLTGSVRVSHEPVGVVGVIAPWNYPLTLAVSDAVAALLAGNAVVLKPDSATPLSALRVAELLFEAGVPREVFHVLPGPGAEVGQAIVANCDYLMFTGSTATGRKLAAQAGERLIGFSGELGGKNPLIVTSDADIQRAAAGAVTACFSNAGQLCISIERIYVVDAVAAEFTRAFVRSVEAMKVGAEHGWNADMGSLISHDHVEKVAGFVDDAVAAGARVLTGGKRLIDGAHARGAYYAPTVLTDVPASARLYREEVFGPVVYIESVPDEDTAIARANDTDYGLNASVWARASTGRRIASRLHAGTVNINEGYATAWIAMDAPMGGWKSSGVGRRHGDGGLLKYTEARTVALQRWTHATGPAALDRENFAATAAWALRAFRDVLR